LENYNDGRRKSFFCLAANLLELQDLKSAMEHIKEFEKDNLSLKEKASNAANVFQDVAAKRGIVLKLNKKPAKSKR
jgi:hypothetical protein